MVVHHFHRVKAKIPFMACLGKNSNEMSLFKIYLLLAIILAAFASMSTVKAASSEVSVLRGGDGVVVPGGKANIRLNVYIRGNVTGLIITEKLPYGFEVLDSRPTASKYDKDKGEVKWLFYSLQGVKSAIINYTIRVSPKVIEGVYTLNGNWSAIDNEGTKLDTTPPTYIRVQKNRSEISCTVSSPNVQVDEAVKVSGLISPGHSNVTIVLTYKKPNGSAFNRTVTAVSGGSYTDAYKVDAAGSWSVIARWLGDEDHSGSVSSTVAFNVEAQSIFSNPMTIVLAVALGVVALIVAIRLIRR